MRSRDGFPKSLHLSQVYDELSYSAKSIDIIFNGSIVQTQTSTAILRIEAATEQWPMSATFFLRPYLLPDALHALFERKQSQSPRANPRKE